MLLLSSFIDLTYGCNMLCRPGRLLVEASSIGTIGGASNQGRSDHSKLISVSRL